MTIHDDILIKSPPKYNRVDIIDMDCTVRHWVIVSWLGLGETLVRAVPGTTQSRAIHAGKTWARKHLDIDTVAVEIEYIGREVT